MAQRTRIPPDRLPSPRDWADCFDESECPGHAFGSAGLQIALDPATGRIEASGQAYSALVGVIEATGTHPFGYDADLIAVRAPVRTVVTVLVEPPTADRPSTRW